MKRRGLTVFTVITVLALASFAFAEASEVRGVPQAVTPLIQGPQGETSGSAPLSMVRWQHKGRMEFLEKKLGLTDEQKKAMRALRAGYQDRTRKARMSLLSLKDEKHTMLMMGNADQKKLAQMDDQIVKLVSEVLTERLKMRRDRLALLTPEQLDRLGDLVTRKGFRSEVRRMHNRHGHGHF
jgi:Spy/CpxP family protein refolding chaperone